MGCHVLLQRILLTKGLNPCFLLLVHWQVGSCPLQDSWASLVAQLVKNLLAMGEAWVQSLGWDDPLEKGKAAHSSILAWRFPWTVSGVAELDMTEQLSFYYFFFVDDRKVLYIFQRLILYIIASIFF